MTGGENGGGRAGRAKVAHTMVPGALKQALEGRLGPHQRFLLAAQVRHVDELAKLIDDVSAEIEERLRPFQEELARLTTIPGVGRRTAETLLSELSAHIARSLLRPNVPLPGSEDKSAPLG
jgi:transposase